MPVRTAKAAWSGTLREGNGTMEFADYKGPFTHASRFGSGEGTNPEELLGAAHAGCFSMFLASVLTRNGHPPSRIATEAHVHLLEGPARIERIELRTDVAAQGVENDDFQKYVQEAKANCPVSKALASVPITVEATLANR